MKILEKIKRIRLLKDISQAQMAEYLEIAPNNYGKLERGITELSIQRLYKISAILGVSVATLLDEGNNTDKIEKLEIEVDELRAKNIDLSSANKLMSINYRTLFRLFREKVESRGEQFTPDSVIEFSYREFREAQINEFNERWDKIMSGDMSPFDDYKI